MYIFNQLAFFFLTLTSLLLSPTQGSAIIPSLEHRQLGSCAQAPCAPGYCCSPYNYCGTGPEYCTQGSCNGGVGGTCAAGLCCSEYGYCGVGEGYCPPAVTTTTTTSTTTTAPVPPPTQSICGTFGPCAPGLCCSQWGWCGSGELYCGS